MKTSPEKIALLFGIPINREHFTRRAQDPTWDYGRRVLAGRSLAQAFDEIYEPVCRVAADMMRNVTAMGVSVYPCATLRDWHDASMRHDVLVVVAHWRGSAMEVDDLLPGWTARLTSAAKDPALAEAAALLLREDLPLGTAIATLPEGSPKLNALAVDTFNRFIRSGHYARHLPGELRAKVAVGSRLMDGLCRGFVDSLLSGHIRPGNQLELTDGLHDVAAVDEALAPTFGGTLDLSCCTSSVLGTFLQLTRGDSVDTIIGDPLIVPGPQLRLIEGALELTRDLPNFSYALARRSLSQGLADWKPG